MIGRSDASEGLETGLGAQKCPWGAPLLTGCQLALPQPRPPGWVLRAQGQLPKVPIRPPAHLLGFKSMLWGLGGLALAAASYSLLLWGSALQDLRLLWAFAHSVPRAGGHPSALLQVGSLEPAFKVQQGVPISQ